MITVSQAIELLKRMQEPEAWEPQITKDAFEALEMAIRTMRCYYHDIITAEDKRRREADVEKRPYWIFTFGYGQPNAGKYVKIYGDFVSARQKMVNKYGTQWAFQYSATDWAARVSAGQHPLETELEVIE